MTGIITSAWSWSGYGGRAYCHARRAPGGRADQALAAGTLHGAVQPEHLDAYLDEFVFRFNRRSSIFRGMLYRLLQQAVATSPMTYQQVTQGSPRPKSSL